MITVKHTLRTTNHDFVDKDALPDSSFDETFSRITTISATFMSNIVLMKLKVFGHGNKCFDSHPRSIVVSSFWCTLASFEKYYQCLNSAESRNVHKAIFVLYWDVSAVIIVSNHRRLLDAKASHCAPWAGSSDNLPAQAKIDSRIKGDIDLRLVCHCW